MKKKIYWRVSYTTQDRRIVSKNFPTRVKAEAEFALCGYYDCIFAALIRGRKRGCFDVLKSFGSKQ